MTDLPGPGGVWLDPGPRRLRPMELGDLLDTGFRLYRENLGCFFGVVLIVNFAVFTGENLLDIEAKNRALAAAVAAAPEGLAHIDAAAVLPPFLALWGFFLTRFCLTQLSMAALTLAVSHRFLGEPAGILPSYAGAVPRFPRLLLTGLLAGICYSAGCVFFCLPGLLLMAAFVFAPLVVVLENGGPIESLRRSFVLTVRRSAGRGVRHNFFKISLILTLFTLVSLAAYALASVPRAAVYLYYHLQGLRPDLAMPAGWEKLLRSIEYLGISAAEPLGMTALVLLYYDIRMRTEGFDLERLIAAVRKGPPGG